MCQRLTYLGIKYYRKNIVPKDIFFCWVCRTCTSTATLCCQFIAHNTGPWR